MTPDPLDAALQEWIERTLSGERLDAGEFARARRLDPAELAPRISGVRWLVGRHQEARAESRAVPQPPFALGDVDVIEETGRGAMGIVFRGIQRSLGRQVAVKVLQAAGREGSKGRTRFLQEARAAARLHHQNLVPVLFVGEERGLAWYAMEWVEGESLASLLEHRIAERSRPDPGRHRESALLTSKVARALHHAHGQGLLHRDVKPSNILVDTAGEPRLTDFGLVRDLSALTLTTTGEVVGSPAYMSPEQVRGDRLVDPRSDVYSLGVTLYECLTRARPFVSESLEGIRREILEGVVVEPRRIDASVPADLQWICLKAMAREPATRYADAAAFAADLEAFLRREPVQARPPSAILEVRRYLRRNRRLALGGMAVACAGVLVFGQLELAARLAESALRELAGEVLVEKLVGDEASLRGVLDRAVARFPRDEGFRVERALHFLQEGSVSLARADLVAAARLASNPDLEEVVAQAEAATLVSERKELSVPQQELLARLAAPAGAPRSSLLLRGEILGFLGEWRKAERLFLEARRLDPRDTSVAGRLGTCYLGLGEYSRARAEADKFTASRATPRFLDRRVHWALVAGDLPAARREVERLRADFGPSAWTLVAELRLPEGGPERIARAEAVLESAEKPPPWAAAATDFMRVLGAACEQERRFDKACRIWGSILEKRPRDANARGVLGGDLMALGRKKKALEQFHQAALDADHLPYQRDHHWGTWHFFSGHLDEAIACFRGSTDKCPGDPTRWRALAMALCEKALAVADADESARLLRASVDAQEAETKAAPGSRRACELLLKSLDQLIAVLESRPATDAAPSLPELRRKRSEVADRQTELLR